MPGLEGRYLRTPFGWVTPVAPIVESANAKETPVVEGVVVEVASTCKVAVVIVAPTPGVVNVTVA